MYYAFPISGPVSGGIDTKNYNTMSVESFLRNLNYREDGIIMLKKFKRKLSIIAAVLMIFSVVLEKYTKVYASSAGGEYIITTIAGNGTSGYLGDGGPATSASLYLPTGVAVDSTGNIYIAGRHNNRIRKIDTNGIINIIAGTGTSGYSGDGGQATSAKLNNAIGVAVDSTGNIYIADADSNCIRKIGTNGVINTIAGNGTSGYSGDGGLATSAQLNQPNGVAVDSIGNIYIADMYNNCIRKIGTDGIINTIAGTGPWGYSGDGGPATSAKLSYPAAVALDSTGNIYIADMLNNCVRKIGTDGVINTIAGNGTVDDSVSSSGYSGDGGLAISAKLSQPYGIAVDSIGNIYISDCNNNRIRKVGTDGIINTIAGNASQGYSGDGGQATSAKLCIPFGVTVDSTGNIYIADYLNYRIRKLQQQATITTVSAIAAKNVANGTILGAVGLPTNVAITLSNNSTASAEVTWDGGTPTYDGSTAGTYTFTGTITTSAAITNPDNNKATVNVIVAAPLPPAPTNAKAVIKNGSAIITFAPPTNNGGSTIIGYKIIQNPGGKVTYGTTSPIRITNVKASDTFTIEAVNVFGESFPVNVDK